MQTTANLSFTSHRSILHSAVRALALVLCGLAPSLTCSARDFYLAALQRFIRKTPEAFLADLDRERPPVLSAALRAQVIAALPQEGEVKRLTAEDRSKLDAVAPVLRAHGREGVYILKVVDTVGARLGLHARFVVLIAQAGLRVLTPATLRAAVAHEIGHEYVWDEYDAARKRRDRSRLRELELYCDGFAVVTLARIGANPGDVISFLNLLYAADRASGISYEAVENSVYPSPAERRKFVAEIRKWFTASPIREDSCCR